MSRSRHCSQCGTKSNIGNSLCCANCGAARDFIPLTSHEKSLPVAAKESSRLNLKKISIILFCAVALAVIAVYCL
jgi:uncharacterized membrane protein YvbJ